MAALALYLGGLVRLWRAGLVRRVVGALRPCCFACGMLALAAALFSPLEALAEQLFYAHMIQHLLLMLVAPPLLVAGRPALVMLWALPAAQRRRAGRAWAGSAAKAALGWLMQPLAVWLAASAALWLWHIPALYDWALADEGVHSAEHLSFFLTAIAFWTLTTAPYGQRKDGPADALWMMVTYALHSSLLGALLTFAQTPLYVRAASDQDGLSALQDQQLAGLIMWIPASAVYLGALAVLLASWLGNALPPFKGTSR